MAITHVIPRERSYSNTPRQILIYEALGAPLPHFAHIPMILSPSASSKRHGAPSVMDFRGMGSLPGAVVNFLARLGWSHGDQEIFSQEELVHNFSLEHVGKATAFSILKKKCPGLTVVSAGEAGHGAGAFVAGIFEKKCYSGNGFRTVGQGG